jgi:glycosyltransferase involved in cell wall biosynthesis
MLRISLIISAFESYEIARRQLLHFSKLNGDFELILVDDGSQPPIPGATVYTNNNLAWTQGLGRNAGAKEANGEYLFFTDIDHIITQEALDDAIAFNGHKMMFWRKIGILDFEGNIKDDINTLHDWGFTGQRDASVHGNTFVIKREDFENLGGYDEQHSVIGFHPKSRGGDDVYFNQKWNRAHRGATVERGRDIYLFPTGRFHKDGDLNPFGFFHGLSQRKQSKFYKYA